MQGIDPDRGLVERAQQGDARAFDHLQSRYRRLVYGALHRQLSAVHAEDLEDLAQSVWIAVHASLPRFRGDSLFSTWLVGISRNVCLQWIRQRKTEGQTCVEVVEEMVGTHEAGPERQAVGRLTLHLALKSLAESECEVIQLRYFVQLTDQEIAQTLDLPLGTVKSRIRAALMRLRKALQLSEGEIP